MLRKRMEHLEKRIDKLELRLSRRDEELSHFKHEIAGKLVTNEGLLGALATKTFTVPAGKRWILLYDTLKEMLMLLSWLKSLMMLRN